MSKTIEPGHDRNQFSEAAEAFMQRALDRAAEGLGYSSPNPPVGAVIVRDGRIVGEGVHRRAGGAHAEVQALQEAGAAANGATLYVTLEPCNHFGRTPPCTKAIIEAGIAEVYYAVRDPNPHVAGDGQRHLQEAGIIVHHGPLTAAAVRLKRFFLHHVSTRRPYVIAKFAASLDGKIATRTGDSQWITGKQARETGHHLRHLCDGIMVGVGTVIADDPRLTARPLGLASPRQPLRIVVDSSGRSPLEARLFDPELPGRTLVATTDSMHVSHRNSLFERGVDVCTVPHTATGNVDLRAVLDELGRRDVTSLLVEGGGELLGSFFAQNLVDEVWAFLAPMIIGGEAAPGAVRGVGVAQLHEAFRLEDVEVQRAGDDILVRGYTPRSDASRKAQRIAAKEG